MIKKYFSKMLLLTFVLLMGLSMFYFNCAQTEDPYPVTSTGKTLTPTPTASNTPAPPPPGKNAAMGKSLNISSSEPIPESSGVYGHASVNQNAKACLDNVSANENKCSDASKYTNMTSLAFWKWNSSGNRWEYSLAEPFVWCSFSGKMYFQEDGNSFGPFTMDVTDIAVSGNYNFNTDIFVASNVKTKGFDSSGNVVEVPVYGCMEIDGRPAGTVNAPGYCTTVNTSGFDKCTSTACSAAGQCNNYCKLADPALITSGWQKDINAHTYTFQGIRALICPTGNCPAKVKLFFYDACGKIDSAEAALK